MNGKLIVHGFDENLLFGGKPIRILIDGKEAGAVSKFETTIIDINKDCTLKLKYGLNTSKPTPISKGMLTEVQCQAGSDRLHAVILRNVPYDAAKENEAVLSEMRDIVARCKNGEMSAFNVGIDKVMKLQDRIVEWTPDVEYEVAEFLDELTGIVNEEAEHIDDRENTNNNEHRMRCNVCGCIFCYTDADLKENRSNASLSALSAIGSLASTLGGGTIFHTHHLQGQSDKYSDKIIDFSHCPACRSSDISEIKAGDAKQEIQKTPVSISSPADELKKFKELLDMGVISQEEFDAKKKQLLGL